MARALLWVSQTWLLVLYGCQANLPSGVFACVDDYACPADQYCHPDGISTRASASTRKVAGWRCGPCSERASRRSQPTRWIDWLC